MHADGSSICNQYEPFNLLVPIYFNAPLIRVVGKRLVNGKQTQINSNNRSNLSVNVL